MEGGFSTGGSVSRLRSPQGVIIDGGNITVKKRIQVNPLNKK